MFHEVRYTYNMKLLITGGHISPALACVDELLNHHEVQLVFVGRRYNTDREKTSSFEFNEISKRNIPFISLDAGRLNHTVSLKNLQSILNIPIGFYQAFKILKEVRPDKILSFGGYIGLPVCLMGRLLGVPLYVHEQTIHPGLANRIAGNFAKKIFVSFEDSKKYFSEEKIIISGNPIRSQVKEVISKPFLINKKQKVIYITGGSLGSHSINEHVADILATLLKDYIVIHQTGSVEEFHDYEKLLDIRSKLPLELKENYFIKKHVATDEIGYIYSMTDLVIGRAGANTFFELINLEKPAILIPLPWSAYQEQRLQAQILKAAGTAEIFEQSKQSRDLLILINNMMSHLEDYKKNFTKLSTQFSRHAEKTIIREILQN